MKRYFRRYKYEAMAGGVSFFILLLAFCYSGIISVTGEKSILICDMYGQYYEFLLGFRHIVLERKSLCYSWNLDMGIGIIGFLAYYVASPFNLLLLVVPESWMIGAVTGLILLKLALSAVTFVLCMKKTFGQYGIECVLGSLCYSLGSFAVTYFFNIMWLDILIWLPLLVCSLKKLVDGKSGLPFLFFLTLAFFSNYYMSYMAGVFLFTCFIAYYIDSKKHIFSKEFLRCFFRFIGSAIVAFGLCGFLLVPTVFQMVDRLGEGTVNHSNGWLQFSILDFFQAATVGSYTSLENGKPLVYCSSLFFILVPLYFLNGRIRKREKAYMGILLLVWFAMMIIPATDLLMHIGNNPTWFPYRYAFVYCFLICIVGTRQLQGMLDHVKLTKTLAVCTVSILLILFLMLLHACKRIQVVSLKGLCISAICIGLYGMSFFYLARKPAMKRDLIVVLAFILSTELMVNSLIIFHNMDKECGFKSYTAISEKQKLVQKQLADIQENTDGFRIEKNYRAGYNDGFAFGYNSLSSFSSVYNKGVHRFFENMGIVNQLWNSSYQGSTSFTDSILGVKYRLHSVRKSKLYLSSDRSDFIEKNDLALPIGFLADEAVTHFKMEEAYSLSPLKKQQELIEALTGEEESRTCFKRFEPDKIICHNAKRSVENGKVIIESIDKNQDSSISYYVSRKGKEECYFYPQFDYHRNGTKYVEVNTCFSGSVYSQFSERSNLSIPYNIRLFDSPKATEDCVTLDLLKHEKVVLDQELFYQFDLDFYKKYYDKLARQSMKVESWKEGYVKGIITSQEDKGVVVLTVPYSKNWNVYVDGKKTEMLSLCQDTFIGIKIPKGTHSIVLEYKEPGIFAGRLISVLCLLFVYYRLQKNTYLIQLKK